MYIIMSKKEMEQIEIFEKLIRKEINQNGGAKILGITERHLRRKIKNFKKTGPSSLIHKNRGKISNRKWDIEKEKFAINLLKREWQGFGPTFAAEKLFELYRIKISEETLRKSMIKHGIWAANNRKIKHRNRRLRKSCFGIMVQLDGSPHDWFEGRASKCTLLVFIDDATSKIVWLEFVKSESVEAVMNATLNYFMAYGMPRSFYVDYGSVFSVNTNNPDREKITQFERALKELDIKIIHAGSPQAKGRVERSNRTHQDRLIKEMRLRNISTIEAANQFLRDCYMNQHNVKFAKEPADSTNVHRPIQGINLNNIFCIKEERKLNNDFTILYQKRIFQLDAQQRTIIKPKDDITVNVHLDGSIRLSIRKIDLFFKEVNERVKQQPKEKIVKDYYHKPNENSRKSLSRFFRKKTTQNLDLIKESRVKPARPAVEALFNNNPKSQ